MDTSTGALKYVGAQTGIDNPSFVAVHPQRRFLYSVSEVRDYRGRHSGAVAAYSINPTTGALTPLNRQPSQGVGPCHVNVDKTGKCVLVANYASGSVAVFPVQADGSLGEASEAIQHRGSSVVKDRQEGPHAHSVNLSPDNRFAFVADLGMDKMMVYRLDAATGKLALHQEVSVKSGAGHTMTAFAYDAGAGKLTELQTLPTLPEGFSGTSHTADVHVHPSGKFLYGSTRGHDSIAIYTIDQRTGKLTLAGHQATQGKTPRNFAIDPSGAFLYAEHQDSDTIVTFRIDQQTGKLMPTGQVTEVPQPVCLRTVALG
jgi:6-phosphogluconolactonase